MDQPGKKIRLHWGIIFLSAVLLMTVLTVIYFFSVNDSIVNHLKVSFELKKVNHSVKATVSRDNSAAAVTGRLQTGLAGHVWRLQPSRPDGLVMWTAAPMPLACDKMVELSIVLWIRNDRVTHFEVWRKELPYEIVIIPAPGIIAEPEGSKMDIAGIGK